MCAFHQMICAIALLSVLFAIVNFCTFQTHIEIHETYFNRIVAARNVSDSCNSTVRHGIKPFFLKRHFVHCDSIVEGNNDSIAYARIYGYARLSELYLYNLLENCSAFFEQFYFPTVPLTNEEARFPIAFVVRANDHVDHLLKLVHAAYAPQNVYCIHVDLKSTTLFYRTVQRLCNCLPNVFLTQDQVGVAWGSFGMLKSALNCFGDLLQSSVQWTYVITLEGHDFPLKTNWEVVQILKHFKGANDVALLHGEASRYSRQYHEKIDHQGLPLENIPVNQWNATKGPVPYNLTIYKNYFQSILSRPFVHFSLTNQRSLDLLNFLQDTFIPEEHFWGTVMHDENLQAPGYYPGRCVNVTKKEYITRYTRWLSEGAECPLWMQRHWMCIFGLDDLVDLPSRKELFLNKFFYGRDPLAIDCWHEHIFNRTYYLTAENAYLRAANIKKFVDNMSAIRFQAWKMKAKDTNDFSC